MLLIITQKVLETKQTKELIIFFVWLYIIETLHFQDLIQKFVDKSTCYNLKFLEFFFKEFYHDFIHFFKG